MKKSISKLSLLLYIISGCLSCSLCAMQNPILSPNHRVSSPIQIIKAPTSFGGQKKGVDECKEQTPPDSGNVSLDSGSDSDNPSPIIKNASTRDLTDLGEVYFNDKSDLAKAQKFLKKLTMHEKLIKDLVSNGSEEEAESEKACMARITKRFLQNEGWACVDALDDAAKAGLNRELENVRYIYALKKGKETNEQNVRDVFDQGTKCIDALDYLVRARAFLGSSTLKFSTLSIETEQAQNDANVICEHTRDLLGLIREKAEQLTILLTACIQTMSDLSKTRFMWGLVLRCDIVHNDKDFEKITTFEALFPKSRFMWKEEAKKFLAGHPRYTDIMQSITGKLSKAVGKVFDKSLTEGKREALVLALLDTASNGLAVPPAMIRPSSSWPSSSSSSSSSPWSSSSSSPL